MRPRGQASAILKKSAGSGITPTSKHDDDATRHDWYRTFVHRTRNVAACQHLTFGATRHARARCGPPGPSLTELDPDDALPWMVRGSVGIVSATVVAQTAVAKDESEKFSETPDPRAARDGSASTRRVSLMGRPFSSRWTVLDTRTRGVHHAITRFARDASESRRCARSHCPSAVGGPWTTGVNDSSVVVALFPRSQRHLIQVDTEDETSEERGEVEQNDHD